MVSMDASSRPSSSRKGSFRSMLDLEKKSKLDRMRASATFAVQPIPSALPPSPGFSYAPSSSSSHMLPSAGSSKAVPMLPTRTPPEQPRRAQLPNSLERGKAVTGPPPKTLTIEVTPRELDEDSDRSSICRSPGWDDGKERKRKQEAKDRRKKEKAQAEKERAKADKERAKAEKEKAKLDRDAKETKKLKKRLTKGPPTNKVFDRMAIPMERSTSAPVLDTISGEDASRALNPSSPSSRRSSLEVGIQNLRSTAGSWMRNGASAPPQGVANDAEEFVGGLKLQHEKDLALQEHIHRLGLNQSQPLLTRRAENPAQRRSISAGAVSGLAGSKVEYLKFQPTMPPESSDSELEVSPFHNQASGAARGYKQPGLDSQVSSSPDMGERNQWRQRSRGFDEPKPMSHQNDCMPSFEERTDLGHGSGSQYSRDAYAERLSPQAFNPYSGTRASNTYEEDVDISRGRKDPALTNAARQISHGRPATTYHAERLAATTTFSPTSRSSHMSLLVQTGVSDDSDENQIYDDASLNIWKELGTGTSRPQDGYHSFAAHSQMLSAHQQEAHLPARGRSSKVYPSSPSFKNFKSAARAAFSRHSQVPPLPPTGSTGATPHYSRPSTAKSLTDSQKALNKAERILGVANPPAPRSGSKQPSRPAKSQSSSLLSSSEDGSVLDEDSNITTPSASRPQSHKDEFSPSREFNTHANTTSEPTLEMTAIPSKRGVIGPGSSAAVQDDTTWRRPIPDAGPGKSSHNSMERRPSRARSLSTPELQQDLSFLPPLKHQALERPSKGKDKDMGGQVPKNAASVTNEEIDEQSLVYTPPTVVKGQRPTTTNEEGGQYLQNARLNVLRASPKSKSGASGSTISTKPATDSIGKMFVVCCSCHYFHDMPSKIYECMTKPDNIVEDKDLGVSGQITTMVRCPWCGHGMSTSCCSGILTTVQVIQKLH